MIDCVQSAVQMQGESTGGGMGGVGGPKRCYLDCVLKDLVGCFCFLAIESNDAVSVGVQVFV